MKILESKYYIPTRVLRECYVNDDYQIGIEDYGVEADASDEPYRYLLDKVMPSIYFKDMVIHRKYLQDFVKCTDYHIYDYDKKTQQYYCNHACYFHPNYEIFLITNEKVSNEEDDVFDKNILRVSRLYYNSRKDDLADKLTEFSEKYLEQYASIEAKISILMKEDKELCFKKHKIKPLPINLETMYNTDFLPVHKKILHDLTNTNKGVVMLHGISGSGKTNYLKWLTSQVPDKDFIFVPNNMIELLLEPSLINLLIDNKNSVIVLEDCENYILERNVAQSNTDVVASILNIADGILSDVLECQFICTFNAK
ncbi:MAG: ATPase, partial [Moraxellaceae bacterium]|nr:ATPase [Moraxellaceae bacterium]